MTAQLPCHVQNLLAKTVLKCDEQNLILIKFTVFKTYGHPVAPGDKKKLVWTS